METRSRTLVVAELFNMADVLWKRVHDMEQASRGSASAGTIDIVVGRDWPGWPEDETLIATQVCVPSEGYRGEWIHGKMNLLEAPPV